MEEKKLKERIATAKKIEEEKGRKRLIRRNAIQANVCPVCGNKLIDKKSLFSFLCHCWTVKCVTCKRKYTKWDTPVPIGTDGKVL